MISNIDFSYYDKSIVFLFYSLSLFFSLNPKMIKVPSACNNNLALLELLRDKYYGEIHISLGMTTKEEEKRIFQRV